jgi:Poxvirus D5 protein-like
MRDTKQTLSTAIGELGCLSFDKPASLDELTALSVARDCIDQLLHSCVDELRTHPQLAHSWSAIADALGSTSTSATRQLFTSPQVLANKQVLSFWRAFAERFAWDFLPAGFLHALYTQWLSTAFPEDTPLSRETFTRRLKAVAIASGEWIHTRSRPGSLMNAAEPLATQLPHWTRDGSNDAVWGLRRIGAGSSSTPEAPSN